MGERFPVCFEPISRDVEFGVDSRCDCLNSALAVAHGAVAGAAAFFASIFASQAILTTLTFTLGTLSRSVTSFALAHNLNLLPASCSGLVV
jgi:hypothetical protein